MANRAAREIVEALNAKIIFTYKPEMEISVPPSDRKTSMDQIVRCYHDDQFTLSDMYIGYAISLFRYTIPRVVSTTVKALGRFWPEKNVPKNIDSDALLSRIKKMCSMGMLRRFTYVLNGNNIVLYSVTPEFSKVIYQALRLNTDARPEKDLIPPIEMVERASASLVTAELLKSPNLLNYDFMPEFRSPEGRITFNARVEHFVDGQKYATIVEPFFVKLDKKRFTMEEWNNLLVKKALALKGYTNLLESKGFRTQIIIVCEDLDGFKSASKLLCNLLPEEYIYNQVYFTGEGPLKSGEYNLLNSMIRITTMRHGSSQDGETKIPGNVSAQRAWDFF